MFPPRLMRQKSSKPSSAGGFENRVSWAGGYKASAGSSAWHAASDRQSAQGLTHWLLGGFPSPPPAETVPAPWHLSFGQPPLRCVQSTLVRIGRVSYTRQNRAQRRRACKERADVSHLCRSSYNPISGIERDRIFRARRQLSPFPFPLPAGPSVATR